MSITNREVWDFWYSAQINEGIQYRSKYTEERPTLVDANPFDSESDSNVLRSAMKGFGTNEDKITGILTQRTISQRMEIIKKYQHVFGRDLIKDLKSELSGSYEKIIMALMMPRSLMLAESIKNATKGAGTDDGALIEILCSRDDESIEVIKNTFKEEYKTSLESVISDETSGNFGKLFMSILATARNDDVTPLSVAEELNAEDIDEDKIRRIVTSYTFLFLKEAFSQYANLSGQTFQDLVKKKCSGDSEKAMNAIYECSLSRTEFYARQLYKAMKGIGTDSRALVRIIVSRCEIDLETIKEKFSLIYDGKNFENLLKKEVSGDVGKALISLAKLH